MRVNPGLKALRNSVLAGAAGRGPADALARSVEAAGQVSASAAEFVRVRRDPAELAMRRRKAAVRRANIWGVGTVVGVAGGAAVVAGGATSASAIFVLVLLIALIAWCTVNLARSAGQVRRCSAVVASLPPPQPGRRPVAGPIRRDMSQLDSYSDGLRHLLSMLPATADGSMAVLRTEVIAAADDAERLLRRQGQEYTGIRRTLVGAPVSARPALQHTADELAGRIRHGIGQYSSLVAAATQTVAAAAALDRALADLEAPTDRLHALAIGMREIAGPAGSSGRSGAA